MKTQNNLTYLAERLQRGKWLIHKPAYEALAKQVDARLSGDMSLFNRITSALSSLVKQSEINSSFTPDVDEANDGQECVAVIPVHGVLIKGITEQDELDFGLCNPDRVSEALDEAMADDSVSEVCLDFKSPGGETLGIEVLARKIARLSEIKSIYGWTDSQSASAAFWLMSQCNSIALSPDAQVGSVGVYCMLEDYSKALEKDGIKVEAIFAGKYKMLGHGFKPLTDDERNILQADIDNTYIKFKSAITSKRDIKDDDLQGLMYEGQTAIDKGYADFTSDTLEDYLDNKETIYNKDMKSYTKIVKQETPEKVAVTTPTVAVTPTISPVAEAPVKDEPKHEDVKADDGVADEEMKHVSLDEDNMAICPHCEGKFSVDIEHDQQETGDEDKGESEQPVKEEPKDKKEDEKPSEATSNVPMTMVAIMGLTTGPKKNDWHSITEAAVMERGGVMSFGHSNKPKGAFASMVESAIQDRNTGGK